MRIIRWLILLFATSFAVPAHAESDRQQWVTLTGDVALDKNDSLALTGIFRSKGDSFDLGQRLVRVGYNHKLKTGVTLNFAYTHVRNFIDGGPDPIQHRFSQSATVPLGKIGGGKLDARIQAEEVLAQGADDLGLRLRPRLRWQVPLDSDGKVEAQFSNELIFGLNDTDYGQFAGLTANRASAGMHFSLSKHVGIAPGYIWQLVNRENAPSRNDHILSLTLDFRL